MRSHDRMILLGKLGKPHGVKGYLYFHYYGDDVNNLDSYDSFQTEDGLNLKLEKKFEKSDRLIIKFESFNDRNSIENLRNKDIYILEADMPELDPGEYYLYQLEGLAVHNLQGLNLGKVDGILGTKSNEVLVVESTTASIDDKQRLIPYLKPQVVKNIELEESVIIVDWPEDF